MKKVKHHFIKNSKYKRLTMRIILFTIYAMIMTLSILNEIDTTYFLLLFIVAPIVIYLFVKKIFPKKS